MPNIEEAEDRKKKMLAVAERYKVPLFKIKCEEILIKDISINNCAINNCYCWPRNMELLCCVNTPQTIFFVTPKKLSRLRMDEPKPKSVRARFFVFHTRNRKFAQQKTIKILKIQTSGHRHSFSLQSLRYEMETCLVCCVQQLLSDMGNFCTSVVNCL